MCDDETEDELNWIKVGETPEGYPIFQCVERPGITRVGVPIDKWRELFRA